MRGFALLVAYVQCLTAALLLLAGANLHAAGSDPAELLQRADSIKTADNASFQALLGQVGSAADRLTPAQRDYLDYLKAWQIAYSGNYDEGVAALQGVLARARDPTLLARARITLLNDQANAAHYVEAYGNLSALLASLPQITDHTAHFLSLSVAALLYNQAGQYDLALQFIDRVRDYDKSARSVCMTTALQAETLFLNGNLHGDDARIRAGIDTCGHVGETLYANTTRIWLASAMLAQHDARGALKLLEPHDAQMLKTNSSAAISRFRSTLAQAYLATGNLAGARDDAQSAIDYANKQVNAVSVADAYKVLYEIAKQQDNDTAALDYFEKYSAADKGYLNDLSARALAYQQVHQQVLDKQRQIDAANDSNKVLALQQQVDSQKARTRLLYIGLLLMGLAIVATWAYRTKRSQLKFQSLARRDGLTGICNRQHFFESAQDALRYSARASRDACLIVIDLDHFKSVNDMHGHAAGDAALRRVVAACQERLRSVDVFGRLGGEEFAILLPDCAPGMGSQRAEEMRKAIASLPRYDALADVLVTASFGVAATRACGYNLTTLIAAADNAMYAAKRAGRNRVSTHQAAGAESADT